MQKANPMTWDTLTEHGLVLLGCGKMGGAMLRGWLDAGFPPKAVSVIDPNPPEWLTEIKDITINPTYLSEPGLVVLAIKPQMMQDALSEYAHWGNGRTLFLSIAAGTSIARLEAMLGADTPIIRAMPNTPAAIGQGISALVANARARPQLGLGRQLLSYVGQVVELDNEAQMDAVTALSGSGPAYVFYLIETMAMAGQDLGLSKALAMQLALATVAGAGRLAETASEGPGELRQNVTSPGGTTAAALGELMDPQTGLQPLMKKALTAAAARSRELAQ